MQFGCAYLSVPLDRSQSLKRCRAWSTDGGSFRRQASDRMADLSRRSDTEPSSVHVCWSITARKKRRTYICRTAHQERHLRFTSNAGTENHCVIVFVAPYSQIFHELDIVPFFHHLVKSLQIAQSLEQRDYVGLLWQVTNQVQSCVEL